MNPLARLAAFLDLRPGEGLTFGLLVGHSFALGGALVFGEVSASALFLTTFGADDLAYVYLAAPAFIALIGVGHVWLARWVSAGRLLTAILMMLCGSAGLFVVGLRLLGGGWLVFALMLWYWALEYLASLEFWALAGRLLNLQQGKRLFGPIGAGQLAAQMAGFWLTPLLVSFVGAENLLLLSTACVGVALVALTVTVRRFPVLAAGPDAEPGEEHTPSGGAGALTEQLKDRYVLAICLGTVLSTGAYLFIEYGFAAQSEARYQDADELARFFGVVFGAMSAAQLPARLFLSRWVLGRFGLGAGLLALPLVTGAGMASVAVAGTFALPIGLIFGLMIATRLGEGVVRDALYRTAELLLYQPLRTEQRLAVQTAVESVVDPLAMGLAGAALLLLGRTDGFTVARLALVSLPIIALWIAVSLASYRGYIVALNRALAKRLLGGQDLALDDAATLGVIEAKLVSPHPGEALYALDLLAQAAPDRLAPRLAVLLAHPEPLVRREVTRRIERLRLVGAVPTLRARLADEGDATTLAALVAALGALGSDDRAVAAPLVPYLRHPDARVRLGAIVALLNGRRSTGAQAAGRLLAHLYESPDPRERVLAAVGLGRLDADRAAGPLGRLLADAEPTVRRAALAAAGQVRAPELWPLAVEGLRAPATRRAAAAALVSGGEGALPAIIAAVASAAGADPALLADPARVAGRIGGGGAGALLGDRRAPATRRAAAAPVAGGEGAADPGLLADLAQVAGRIGGDGALALLKDLAEHADGAVRAEALRALARRGFRATAEGEVARVRALVRAEVAGAAGLLAAQVDLDGAADGGDGRDAPQALALLCAALAADLAGYRDRLCHLLAFLYDADTMRRVRAAVADPAAERQSYALELLSLLVAPDLRSLVLPLFADLAPAERLHQLRAAFPQPRLGHAARLAALIGDGAASRWTRTCALYAAGQLGDTTPHPAAVAALAAPAPPAGATALCAARRLDGVECDGHVTRLHQDPQVARAIRQVGLARQGGAGVLSTIEKVVILKTVDVFGRLDDPLLAEVAGLLEEEEVAAGQTVFSEGDLGTSMYIIVDGEVRVHSGGHTLNHLGAREVFGEMALLDPEPRLASVTAVVDTSLLRLDQAPFYELLEDRIELARGIIQMLSRRLRARVADLNALRARLAGLEQRAAGGEA